MTTITRSQMVLDRRVESKDGTKVSFTSSEREAPPEDKGICDEREFNMAVEDWRDFGCPEEITITIEPGDKLNRG